MTIGQPALRWAHWTMAKRYVCLAVVSLHHFVDAVTI